MIAVGLAIKQKNYKKIFKNNKNQNIKCRNAKTKVSIQTRIYVKA